MPAKKAKNMGEENEVFFKAFLTKHYRQGLELVGAPEDIRLITTLHFERGTDVPKWDSTFEQMLTDRNYHGLKKYFSKSKTLHKADIFINDVSYSIKFNKAAKPAIVNHTTRAGFLRVFKRIKADISQLDELVNNYWDLRTRGTIKEDISNSDERSPFKDHKEYLAWILIYFIFEGTGSRDSAFPANQLLSFSDPFDPTTYKILSKKEAVDSMWDHLVFSIRTKGMPKNYDPAVKHEQIAPWVRSSPPNYKPRGALHVRVDSY